VAGGLRARPPHLLVKDGAGELEEAISWVLEQRRVSTVGVHPDREISDGDSGPKVDNISNKVGQVNFGIVNLDHCPIFRKSFLSNVERGRYNDVAEYTVLLLLPVFGDVRVELLEDSDRLPLLLQLGQDLIPLRLSILYILLLSILQPALEIVDGDVLAINLGLDGRDMLLNSGVTKQQDVPAALTGVAVLVELVGFFFRVEEDVSCRDEVDIAGVERVRDEESARSLDGWGIFGADRETEGSGERLSGEGGGIGSGDGPVHLGTSGPNDHRLANFDVDVDIVSGKNAPAVNRDLDALLCSERARDDSYPYDNGRGRLASVPHANWVQTRPLDPLGVQIANHVGADCGLPDLSKRVQSDRTRLLRKKVCFETCWLEPDVRARASDQTGSRG